jgi:hypothetical protein
MRKYYPSDHIRRTILLGSFDAGIWKSLETIVFFESLRAWRQVQVGRTKQVEIDFLLSKGEQTMYLQVAYLLASPEVITREIWSMIMINDNYPKYVVSLDPIQLWQKDGISHIQARKLWDILY